MLTGGLSAIGAGLFSLGIPKDSVVNYETALKADKFLLVAHGTDQELSTAKSLLESSEATQVNLHP